MSTTVDNRVVEMRFDNSNFEKNVKNTLKSLLGLDKTIGNIGKNKGLTEFSQSANSISLKNLESSVENVEKRFSNLGIVGMTVLQNITNSVLRLGQTMLTALTVEPIRAGLLEYEDQINSVQVIMANTGRSVKDVNAALDELNEYADLTIYKFGDMTKNAGMFTAAGMGLEDTMVALKGIGNWAAYAGAGTADMSRATYQLGQALAAGSIRLQDWMSVEHAAGMAGKKYRDAFIQTAKDHGIAVDEMIEKNGSFRESLREGWLTTDIFLETMQKFANDQSMTDAATKIKTFSQLVDTVKEALGTGWATTFRTIIGDFEEARELWTGIYNVIDGVIGKSADARNELLKNWAKLGGRTDLFEGLKNVFEGIVSVIKPIKEAFRDIFPPMTAKRLAEITRSFRELTENFKLTESQSEALKSTFKGLFSILKVIVSIVGSAIKVFAGLVSGAMPILDLFVSITGAIGGFVSNIAEAISEAQIFSKVADLISSAFSKVGEVIGNLGKNAGEIFGSLADIVGKFFDKISNAFGNTSSLFEAFQSLGVVGIFAAIIKMLKKLESPLDAFTGLIDSFKGTFSGISDILGKVRECFELYQSRLKADILLRIAAAIGILAASLMLISSIDAGKLVSSLAGLEVLALELVATMAILDKLSLTNVKGFVKTSTAMVIMSASILILASAMKSIAELDWGGVARGITGIAGLAAVMTLMTKVLSSSTTNRLTKGITGMIAMAAAIKILAGVMEDLAGLSWSETIKGLTGVVGVMASMFAFSKAMETTGFSLKTAASLVILGAAIKSLSNSVSSFASLDLKGLAKGLGALAVLMAEVSIFSQTMKNVGGFVAAGVGMVIMAKAMSSLAEVVAMLGGLNLKELGKGLLALAVGMAEMVAAAYLMQGGLPGAAAMLVMSVALKAMASAIEAVGSLSIGTIVKGLVGLAAGIALFAGASILLSPAIPLMAALGAVLLLVSAAVAVFGAGLVTIGAGLTAIAAGFTALAAVGTAAASTVAEILTTILDSVINLISEIAKELAEGFVTFTTTIAENLPVITENITMMFTALLEVINENIPMIVETILNLLTQLLESLAEYIPRMAEAGVGIVLGFVTGVLNGVAENLESIINAALNLVVSFINGLANAIVVQGPAIANAASNLVLSFAFALGYAAGTLIKTGGQLIDAVIQGFRIATGRAGDEAHKVGNKAGERMGDSKDSFKSSGGNLISGAISGLWSKAEGLFTAIGNIASRAASKFASILGINSPSKVFMKLASYIPEGIILGVTKMEDKVYSTVGTLGENMITPMNNALAQLTDISNTDMTAHPTISPVLDLSNISSQSRNIDSMLSRKQAYSIEAGIRERSDVMETFKKSLVSGVQDAVRNAINAQAFEGTYTIEVPLNLDAREFAKATASFTQSELNKRTIRLNRKNGIL